MRSVEMIFGAEIAFVSRIVGNDLEAVSNVSVSDGVQNARIISFFTVANGLIAKMLEFWSEDFPASENRKHWLRRSACRINTIGVSPSEPSEVTENTLIE